MTSYARAEREQLCDLAAVVGPEAPTLCGDWDVRDLLVHLIVREDKPWAAPGILVPALSFLTERASAQVAQRSFARLVEDVRKPPFWSPAALGPLDAVMNLAEFFVHHEDIRRAQPTWSPRELPRGEQDALFRVLTVAGRALVMKAGVPVRIRRTDTDDEAWVRRGRMPATIVGLPAEIVLYLFGRKAVADVTIEANPTVRKALAAAPMGL